MPSPEPQGQEPESVDDLLAELRDAPEDIKTLGTLEASDLVPIMTRLAARIAAALKRERAEVRNVAEEIAARATIECEWAVEIAARLRAIAGEEK